MLKLNLGRSCLEIIMRTYGIKEIFIPYYSCNVLYKAARKENCRVKFYHIDENFLPVQNFNKNDFILYINYFGLFDDNCQKLAEIYPNLIVDNTQSFYSKPYGIASFNSLRKFFNVQNGAYLYMNKNVDISNLKSDDLFLQPACINSDYEKFKSNELRLNSESIKLISPVVEKQMANVDFEEDKNLRRNLYKKYSQIFDKYNLIKLPELKNSVPYCYPFCPEIGSFAQNLNEHKINILRLWEDMPKEFSEYKFLNNVGAFPLNNEKLYQKIRNAVILNEAKNHPAK